MNRPFRAPPQPGCPRLIGLGLGLALVILGAKLWLIARYGVATPVWDQWDAEGAGLFLPYLNHTLTLKDFFAPHNEHRIVFPRLLALGLLVLNRQWDAKLEMTANAALHTATALLLFWMLARRLHPRLIGGLALTVLAAFALPFGCENTLSGFQSAFYFLFLSAVAALALLTLSPRCSTRWWLGLLAAGLGIFTMASGFFAAAAVCALLVLEGAARPRAWKDQALPVVCCLAVVAGGLALTVNMEGHRTLHAQSVADFLAALAKALAWPNTDWPWMSLVNVLPIGLLLTQHLRAHAAGARAPVADRTTERFTLALSIWVFLQAAASAYARGAHGAGPVSRYMDLLSVGMLANMVAIILLLTRDTPRLPARPLWSVCFTGWLIVTAAGLIRLSVFDWGYYLPLKKRQADAQTAVLRAYLATGDRQILLAQPPDALPYPHLGRFVTLAGEPGLQAILPADVRRPLPVIPRQITADAFVRDGYYPTTPAPGPGAVAWGSYSARGNAAEGLLESEPLPRSRLPILQFDLAGYLGESHLLLKCVDLSSGHERMLHPSEPARETWRPGWVKAPRNAFKIVAWDDRHTRWFAFQEPREMGYWSWRTVRWTERGGALFQAGALLLATLLLWPYGRRLLPPEKQNYPPAAGGI